MKRLAGKSIIVTGAADGIGGAIARLFAEQGADVMATDIQEDKLRIWVNQAKSQGLSVEYAMLDVTKAEQWYEVVQKTEQSFGKVNGLVNNAGIYPGMYECEQTDIELWNKVLAVNLTGPFLGCKQVIPFMIKVGGGSIVNIASIAGKVGGNGAAYSASKGGLLLLSKDLAVNYARHHIRVNAICPGGVLTPMTKALVTNPQMQELIKTMSPQGRMAEPYEIASAALYMMSDEASFMTGAEMVIDGGAIAR